jgi:hypothetical protein
MRGIKIILIAPIGGLIAGLSAVGEKKTFSHPRWAKASAGDSPCARAGFGFVYKIGFEHR